MIPLRAAAPILARPHLLAPGARAPEAQQRRSREKRERLEAAALELFGERGFAGASVGDIARRARLAVGTFYQHFDSKRDLLIVLMDDLLDQVGRVKLLPTAGGDVRNALRGMLGEAFTGDRRSLGVYRAWEEATFSDPEIARHAAAIRDWTRGRALAALQFLHSLPRARQDVDLATLADAMDTLFWHLLGRASRMPTREVDRWVDTTAHLLYCGVFDG